MANHFGDSFRFFLNENQFATTHTSLKFVHKDPVEDCKPALIQVMSGYPNRQQAITWTNEALNHWHINASTSLNE